MSMFASPATNIAFSSPELYGYTYLEVSGETYHWRALLAKHGGIWLAEKRVWYVPLPIDCDPIELDKVADLSRRLKYHCAQRLI